MRETVIMITFWMLYVAYVWKTEKTPSNFSLNISEIENDNNMNYLHALQAIFNNAKEYVQKTTTDSKLDMWYGEKNG